MWKLQSIPAHTQNKFYLISRMNYRSPYIHSVLSTITMTFPHTQCRANVILYILQFIKVTFHAYLCVTYKGHSLYFLWKCNLFPAFSKQTYCCFFRRILKANIVSFSAYSNKTSYFSRILKINVVSFCAYSKQP